MSGTREPEVGEILLFCIDEIGEGRRKKYRPFLVVSVVDGDACAGEVFADPLLDSKTAWALKLFYRLDKDTRTQWVSGVLPGEGVGTWRFKDSLVESNSHPSAPPPEKKPSKHSQRQPIPLSQIAKDLAR